MNLPQIECYDYHNSKKIVNVNGLVNIPKRMTPSQRLRDFGSNFSPNVNFNATPWNNPSIIVRNNQRSKKKNVPT